MKNDRGARRRAVLGHGTVDRISGILRLLLGCTAFVLVGAGGNAWALEPPPHVSTAFYYGASVPSELVDHFDRVVVEADPPKAFPAHTRAQLFAYVSVGEVHPSRPWRHEVPASLVLGSNRTWGTDVVDTRSEEWLRFLLDHIVDPLYRVGFRGVFLDTMDSYERFATSASDRSRHARGIANIVLAIRQRYPDMKVLMNRGFDVLPLLASPPDGLVVESLFRTADGTAGTYREVPVAERQELLRILTNVRERWPIPITVIDYVSANDKKLRREVANQILRSGFDPYVATPALDSIGVGRVEIVPRRVLILYKNHPEEGYLGQQDACVLLAPILEWLGYVVDYVDVGVALPAGDTIGRYAGIVALMPERAGDPTAYRGWLLEQIDQGQRVVFLDGFGFDADVGFLDRLGLEAAGTTVKRPVKIQATPGYAGFETAARPRIDELSPLRVKSGQVRSLLRTTDADGAFWDGVVIGPWGGAAFAPDVLSEELGQERRWVIDPFKFIHDALALEAIPAPDVTTESGRRILTVHIDGDAFVSKAERRGTPYAGEVVLDEILKRHPIPHTVSVVEGEIAPWGLYPKDSPALEAIARRIFALPYVEIGSHTFSHPFDWADAEAGRKTSPPATLPIPNYKFSLEREIRGSIDYVNGRLAPPGKFVRVLQWSGDCSPSREAVALAQSVGVENVNGGGATRTMDFPSLTRASPLGIPKGDGVYQVFAPVENEYVFTQEWRGPYYGYDRARETFELNESPRRMSIISIYYHFYSAIKTASLAALQRVYDWALRQETTKLYLSEYAEKVRAFQAVSLARRVDDGGWEFAGLDGLRTVRLESAWGWPDLKRSVGVAGVFDTPQGRYVHLARQAPAVVLVPSPDPPMAPFLAQANGAVLRWETHGTTTTLRLKGNEALVFDVASPRGCTLRTVRGATFASPVAGRVRFALPESDTGEATLDCP
jgi:hypothetical protein